jgi:hypothetical protein
MDLDIADLIIRTAIFGVMAAAVIGTVQNILGAVKEKYGKGNRSGRV